MKVKKIVLEICQGTSCHLLGAQELLEALETLPDRRREAIDIQKVDCLKSCRQGPNIRIDGVTVSGLTADRLLGLLEEKFSLQGT